MEWIRTGPTVDIMGIVPDDSDSLPVPADAEPMPGARERAAWMVADDRLSDRAIAREIGISTSTLLRWKARPEFAAAVNRHRLAIRAKIREEGIAVVENRVRTADELVRKLKTIIEERASDPELDAIPGGRTGLVVKRERALGDGRIAIDVAADTAIVDSIVATQRYASQELGHWAQAAELAQAKAAERDDEWTELQHKAIHRLGGDEEYHRAANLVARKLSWAMDAERKARELRIAQAIEAEPEPEPALDLGDITLDESQAGE